MAEPSYTPVQSRDEELRAKDPGYYYQPDHERNCTCSAHRKSMTLMIIQGLVLLATVGLWFSMFTRTGNTTIQYSTPSPPSVLGLSQSQLPNITFHGQDFDYMSLDHKFDHLWADDMTAADKSIVTLPDGTQGGVAMFHYLHCVAGMRHALQRAREGENIGLDWHDDAHWPHCLDSLRRMIICIADDTIERPWDSRHKDVGFISGAWDLRVCGNAQKLYELKDAPK